MKHNRLMALAAAVLLAISINVMAQTAKDPQKVRPRTTSSDQKKKPVVTDRLEPDETSRTPTDVSDEMQANRQEQMSEEAAINP
jgi:hypothetical protein